MSKPSFLRLALMTGLLLPGCSYLHTGSELVEGQSRVASVEVKDITATSVVEANAFAYTPNVLPAAFTESLPVSHSDKKLLDTPELPAEYSQLPRKLDLIPPPKIETEPYKLGEGDVVLIATPQVGSTVEQLTGLLAAENARQGYTVQDGGFINIPKVGRINVGGLTIREAEATLFEALIENQIDPTFSLEVSEFNSKKVSISGAVRKPTVVPLTLTPLYLDSALAAAGGITAANMEFASVRLFRNGKMFQIPITDLYANVELLKTRLIDGDSIYVDTQYNIAEASRYFEQQIRRKSTEQEELDYQLRALKTEGELVQMRNQDARERFKLRSEYGAEPRHFVYLAGEVNRQSKFALPYNRRATLAETLFSEAGGINLYEGNVGKVYVLRSIASQGVLDKITAWRLDAANAASFLVATRFEMRPDDVVFVATQPVTRWSRIMSQLLPGVDVIDGSSAVESRSF